MGATRDVPGGSREGSGGRSRVLGERELVFPRDRPHEREQASLSGQLCRSKDTSACVASQGTAKQPGREAPRRLRGEACSRPQALPRHVPHSRSRGAEGRSRRPGGPSGRPCDSR